MEKSMEVRQKNSNPASVHISGEDYNLKIYMHSYVHSSTIYNSQDMEATSVSIDRWMDEEDRVCVCVCVCVCVYTHTGKLLIHRKNEIMSSAATWMDLEIIILSQTEKNKYRMI